MVFFVVVVVLFFFVLLIGAYPGTTFETFDVGLSLLTTMESVCQFLRVGSPLFLREPICFLHFKKNQNVPEFQIPHAKWSPGIREKKKNNKKQNTNFENLNVEVRNAERFLS